MTGFYHEKCKHPSPIRRAITRVAFLSNKAVSRINEAGLLLQKVANIIRFEQFWDAHVRRNPDTIILPSFTRTRTKHPIWDIALEHAMALGTDGLILEFGVHNGGSLFYFSKHVPKTMSLVGFDCFAGIPEPWDALPRGTMKGYGAPVELWSDLPELKAQVIEEARNTGKFPSPPQENVSIEVGLFSESVPRFLRNGIPPDVRLIHFDADIYMSTRPVLDSICGQINYTYYILFDELYSVNHEFRAWMEFVELYSVSRWRVVAISEDGVQALIKVN